MDSSLAIAAAQLAQPDALKGQPCPRTSRVLDLGCGNGALARGAPIQRE